jgi:hypothetical protein
MNKHVIRWFAVFPVAAALFSGEVTRASADDNCQRLETLSQQYAGVTLTVDQERLKRRLVVWYERNCREHRTANAN